VDDAVKTFNTVPDGGRDIKKYPWELQLGKIPLGVAAWEVAAWENTLGKLSCVT